MKLSEKEIQLLISLSANESDIELYQSTDIGAANFNLLELFQKQLRWVKSSIESEIEHKEREDFEKKSLLDVWEHYSKGRRFNSIDSKMLADKHKKESVLLRKKGVLFAEGRGGSVKGKGGLTIYRKEDFARYREAVKGEKFDFSQPIKLIYND